MDSAEVDGDLVWDVTEIPTSMRARLYGKRAAQNRAKGLLPMQLPMNAGRGDGEVRGS